MSPFWNCLEIYCIDASKLAVEEQFQYRGRKGTSMKIATRPKKIMRRQTCSLGGSFLCCYWFFKLCIVSASTDLPIDEEGSCDPSSLGDCLNTNLDTSKYSVKEKSNSCKLYMAPTTVGGIDGNYACTFRFLRMGHNWVILGADGCGGNRIGCVT